MFFSMTSTESPADSDNTAFSMEHCGVSFHLEDDSRCRKRKRVNSVQPEPGFIKCAKPFQLEDNTCCRKRKKVSSGHEKSEAACSKIQDLIPESKACSPGKVLTLTQFTIAAPTPAQVQEFTDASNSSPDLSQVQDLILKPNVSTTPDLPQVLGLTQLTITVPKPAQAQEFTESSTTCPVQDLFPTPQASPTELSPDGVQKQNEKLLLIHGYTVEEYQKIYNSVVDKMLKYKNGRPRPYSLQLGRIIKQRLWEKLNCPQITLQEGNNGLLIVSESHEKRLYPPLIEVDISHEPDPREPSRKNTKDC